MSSDDPTADGTHQGEPRDNGTDQWSSTELSIRAIAEQFMADMLAGKADLKKVVSEHPDLAPALGKRLRVVQSLFNVFSSKDDIAAGSFAAGLEGSQRGRVADQARRLSCPNCGVRLQIVETVHHADVTCSGCGSNIRVEPGSTRALSSEYYASKIGRFELIELIGRGGFGSVYRARDPDLSREVAIKIPREGYFETLNERARFLRKARHAAKLRHPNIVQVHEIAKDDSLPYIVTDYIDGLTLADLIRGRRMTFRESTS